jgi:hypothetical protein
VGILGQRKTVSVGVKMSQKDHELLRKAAEMLWPEADMSQSSLVLSLARMAARMALDQGLRAREIRGPNRPS